MLEQAKIFEEEQENQNKTTEFKQFASWQSPTPNLALSSSLPRKDVSKKLGCVAAWAGGKKEKEDFRIK